MAINKIPVKAFTSGDLATDVFTATAGQTAFTLSLSATDNSVIVYVNDVVQAPTTDYTVNGTTLTFTSGLTVGDEVIIRIIARPSVMNTVEDGAISAAKLATGAIETKLGYTPVSPTLLTSSVNTAVSNLVNAAPTTLDTLNELATALGNDANFATTVTTALGTKADATATTTALATKAPINSPTFTGTAVNLNGPSLQVNGSDVITSGAIVKNLSFEDLRGKQYTQTSTSSTTSIVDTGINLASIYAGIYDIYVMGNPNSNGSGSYLDTVWYTLIIGTGWSGSAVTTYINSLRMTPVARSLYTSGSGQSIDIDVVIWNGTNETQNIATGTSSQIRVKVKNFGGTVGAGMDLRIVRRL